MRHRWFAFLALFLALCLPAAAWGAVEHERFRKLGFMVQEGRLEAPGFTTEDAAGNRVDLASFRGRLVALNFWATWCPPCRLEMPAMEKLYREFRGRGLEVVAVNFMESAELVRAFAEEQNLTYPMLLDRQAEVAERYGVMRLPVTVLIGREGEVIATAIGYKDWYHDDVRQLVAALLGDGQAAAAAGQVPPAGGQAGPAGGSLAPAAGGVAPAAGQVAPAGGSVAPATGQVAPAAGGRNGAAQASLAGGYGPALLWGAALLVVAGFIAWRIGRRRARGRAL